MAEAQDNRGEQCCTHRQQGTLEAAPTLASA